MSSLGDIEIALDCLDNSNVTLMHCISWYPAAIETTNLNYMQTLRSAFDVPVGYSDHTLGTEVSLAAVALGAVCIEKHFTDNVTSFGPDHSASIDPKELLSLSHGISVVHKSLGSSKRIFSDKEIDQRRVHRRSIVASSDIKKGDLLTLDNLTLKRPGTGLQPHFLDQILGKHAGADINSNSLVKCKISLLTKLLCFGGRVDGHLNSLINALDSDIEIDILDNKSPIGQIIPVLKLLDVSMTSSIQRL